MTHQVKLVVITSNGSSVRLTRYLAGKRESAVELQVEADTSIEGLKFVIEDYRVNGDRAIK